MPPTDALSDDQRAAARRAADLLRAGGLVAFPTETVYGLGADAQNARAVERLFAVKGRPADHPLIVHLASAEQLSGWTAGTDDRALGLARAFWPGPLTLVLRRHPRVPLAVTGGLETVGLRVPAHPLALEMLRAFEGGIAAPSANRFGRVSPTTAAHVRADLGDDVDLILDGGPCAVGVESTIVDLSGASPAILRPGAITAEALASVLGRPLAERADDAGPRAPGRLPAHYAPRTPLRLVRRDEISRHLASAGPGHRMGVLDLDGALAAAVPDVRSPRAASASVVCFAVPGGSPDLESAARALYAGLRALDTAGCAVILAVAPEERGLGVAVADRLRRAAAGSGPLVAG